MKKLLWLLPLLIFACKKQDVNNNPIAPLPPPVIATLVNGNQTVLVADTTIDSIWDGKRPDGSYKLLTITDGYKIHTHGHAVFQHWDIDASVNQEVFDTGVDVRFVTTAKTPFSTTWYGAHVKNSDNWWNIQKSINVCKDYALICQLPEHGSYKISNPVGVYTMLNGVFQQCSVKIFGDATVWNNQYMTTLQATRSFNDTPAVYFQLNKGSVFAYIGVAGLFKSPVLGDSAYKHLVDSTYKDISPYHLPDSNTGIGIDPFWDGHSISGSTGIEMDHITLSGFAKGIVFSGSGHTSNCDHMSIDYLNFLDNIKYGIWTTQAQEKNNEIDNIASWGKIFCIVHHYGGGNYTFDGASIAGSPVKLFDVIVGHWFPSSVSNWYCESAGYIGNFNTQVPFTFEDCVFNMDFFMGANCTQRQVLLSSCCNIDDTQQRTGLNFHGCTIRYYDGATNFVYYHGYLIAPLHDNSFGYFGTGTFTNH